MEYAIHTICAGYEDYLSAARWAEAKGLAAFAVPDHYIYGETEEAMATPAHDAFAVMAGLARDTSDIELVILVSPITFRHPAVLAKNAATIQEMASGRFKLGVGTGWNENEHNRFGMGLPALGTRFEMLEEALGYLRACFADPPTDFDGEYYSLEAFNIQPRPQLRLVVGGTGAVRTPQLAGTYADELHAYPAPGDEYRARVERARSAAVAADRDPTALLISSAGRLLAADTEGEYRDKIEAVARKAEIDPEELEAAAAKRNEPRGTWDQVRSILSDMQESGLARFYFQGEFDPAEIELKLSNLT